MKILSSTNVLERFDLNYLNSISTFGALSNESVLWLLDFGKLIEFEAGEVLFSRSERGDSFFSLIEGQVSYYKWHNSRYSFIRHYHSGQQIGFMSMVALHPRVGKAVADKATLAIEIGPAIFHRLLDNYPSDFGVLVMNLAREMARTLCAVDEIAAEKGSVEPDNE